MFKTFKICIIKKSLFCCTGDCYAGYYCRNASISKTPSYKGDAASNAGICPPGFYCPNGLFHFISKVVQEQS